MMDGEIWVESQLGEGAVFMFTVKLACNRDDTKKLFSPTVKLDKLKLLVVDKDRATLTFFEETAMSIGISVDTATNTPDALTLIADNKDYSLCFVALQLGSITGIELAKLISKTNADNKVVLMVSEADWNLVRDEAKSIDVIISHVAKPLFVSTVADCINKCLYVPDNAQIAGDENEPDFEGHHILLVEDVDINREIVQALLEPTKIQIDCAVNGAEAVMAFTSNPLKYDMIFMDIQMPEMDGFTATRLIRASGVPRARDIPIVAMTANAFKEDIDKCLNAGMNEHIGKPLEFERVIESLKRILK
jgi:CheY-like chemotaxis protein